MGSVCRGCRWFQVRISKIEMLRLEAFWIECEEDVEFRTLLYRNAFECLEASASNMHYLLESGLSTLHRSIVLLPQWRGSITLTSWTQLFSSSAIGPGNTTRNLTI